MDTKYCPKCDATQSVDKFGKNKSRKDGYQNYCNACRSDYNAEWYQDNFDTQKERVRRAQQKLVDLIWNYKSANCCIVCGEDDPIVLQFHHRDSESKSFNVSDFRRNGAGAQRILKEIEKCDVVCANCHQRITYYQRRGVVASVDTLAS